MERMTDQVLLQPPIINRRPRAEDSWIEITSQPASSSLRVQEDNDIITSGLNVRPGRRQVRPDGIRQPAIRSTSVAGSSQDEYEESESESDRVMSSSNEDINQYISNGDEVATMLGTEPRNVFTPQPNAFSHPPRPNNTHSASVPNSYFPVIQQTSQSDRLPSNGANLRRTAAQAPVRRDYLSARPQPDHDAALRASLTTLLSCAAAVRPSKETGEREIGPISRPSLQPTSLRLVPESELNPIPQPPKAAAKRRSRESSKERHSKKIRAIKANPANDEVVSPTVMTWMISAGVVLVFSAISFSAGYAWGKEMGRIEGQLGSPSGNCGSEALRSGGGLRKLRWSAATQSSRA